MNRLGVAGAALLSPQSFIYWLSWWWSVKISSKHCQSKTCRARELKFERMLIPNYVSCVTCHASHVMRHVSFISSHKSTKKIKSPFKKSSQSGGASQWRVCWSWGLPCLVSKQEPGWTWHIGNPIESIIRKTISYHFWLFGLFLDHFDPFKTKKKFFLVKNKKLIVKK